MLKGFKDFLLRGNVVDLAVAVVIGTAFAAVVSAFATDFIGGIIGAIGGTPNFNGAGFEANDSKVIIGSTITALINFVIVAAAVYFFVVVPVNRLMERRKRGEEPEVEAPSEDIVLLQEIRDLLRARGGRSGARSRPARGAAGYQCGGFSRVRRSSSSSSSGCSPQPRSVSSPVCSSTRRRRRRRHRGPARRSRRRG